MARAERPRWRVNEVSNVGHALVHPGDEVYYTPTETEDGSTNGVGENLSPLNDEAQAIVDAQKVDHPDKTKHAARRRARADVDEEEAAEIAQATSDGPVPKASRKGETKSAAPPKAAPPKDKKGAKPKDEAKEPAEDEKQDEEHDDEDVG